MEKDSTDELIEFDEIRKLINLQSPKLFKYYLRDVYRELSERKQSDKSLGISKVNFFEYIKKIQYFLADKLFVAMDENGDEHLNQQELLTGFFDLYMRSFEDALSIIFKLVDFNKDGLIERDDMELVLSYLPIAPEDDEQQFQLKSREEIKEIVKKTFGTKTSLTFEQYKQITEIKTTDSFLHILCYFYKNKPFTSANLEIYSKSLKKPLDEGEFSPSLGKKILSPKKSRFLGTTDLITTNFEEVTEQLGEDQLDNEAVQGDVTIQMLSNPNVDSYPKDVSASPVLRMNRARGAQMDSPSGFLRKAKRKESEQMGSPKGKFRSLVKHPKEDNDVKHEGWICKITEGGKIKRFYLCLVGADIYYYKTDSKKDLQGTHNMSGCFFKELGEKIVGSTTLFTFSIVFSNKERKYYTETKHELETWKLKIREALGFSNFRDYYELKEALGEGKFGAVKRGIHKKTGKDVAVKIISKENMDNKDLELVYSEIQIMIMCRHHNIVRILDHYESSKTIYIVMEHLRGGNLNDYLNENSNLTEDFVAFITRQVAEGLSYLHSYGVVHRDLKPENIMLESAKIDFASDSCVKIMDFGLSKILGPNEKAAEGFGTLSFVAPEVLTRNPYGRPVDVWSLGVTIFYMISGQLPFDDPEDNEEVIAKKIVFSELKFPSKYFKDKSTELQSICRKLMVKNQDKRIEIQTALSHPWFNKKH